MMSHHDVRFTIAVNVANHSKPRLACAQRKLARAKTSASVSQEQRQRATLRQLLRSRWTSCSRSGDDIKLTVAIDVADGKRIRAWTNREWRARCVIEAAAPIAQSDRHIIV